MRKINARKLLEYSSIELLSMLTGEFILVFDDNVELITNARETQYSSFGWNFHREYPKTPLLIKHHVKNVINENYLSSNTHLLLLGTIMWDVYDTYVSKMDTPEIKFRDKLAKRIYELTNEIYNVFTIHCENHVTSLDILNFIDIINYDKIKNANNAILPTQKSIDETYTVIKDVIYNDKLISNNPIAMAAKSKLVNIDQVLQCISARGFITDTDSVLFKVPITRGYVQGLRSFYDSFIETRSAAKSLIFSKSPLQQAEYFSRRLQLMTQVVQNLHMGDCGSKKYLLWNVRGPIYDNGILKKKGDLQQLVGKHYMDTDGVLKTIRSSDTHLIGKTLKLRTVIHCGHPDPYGICSACFGEMSYSVPESTNIGQMCCTSLAQKSSQSVLSVKHLDGSSIVDGISLSDHYKKYLAISNDENSYLLSSALKSKSIKIVIPITEAPNLIDIMEVSNVTDLNITRVSELTEIGILVNSDIESLKVNISQRHASITYALLDYIKHNGWGIDEKGNYLIDMKDWDYSKEILTLPLRHANLSEHSADIASMLESSMSNLKLRDKVISPNTALVELFDLVNSKLTVNLAVLDVVLYATMVVSSEDNNFDLPKPHTQSELGVMVLTIANRSLSAAMAYEGHKQILTSPSSYIHTNRMNHPLDSLLVHHN